MVTLSIKTARKILGKRSKKYTDEQLKKELEFTTFVAEVVFREYKKKKLSKLKS